MKIRQILYNTSMPGVFIMPSKHGIYNKICDYNLIHFTATYGLNIIITQDTIVKVIDYDTNITVEIIDNNKILNQFNYSGTYVAQQFRISAKRAVEYDYWHDSEYTYRAPKCLITTLADAPPDKVAWTIYARAALSRWLIGDIVTLICMRAVALLREDTSWYYTV